MHRLDLPIGQQLGEIVIGSGNAQLVGGRRDFSAEDPRIPATFIPSRRSPSVCAGPMSPVPTMATLNTRIVSPLFFIQ